MPSPKPAVIIRREFEATPEVVTQQLRACIIGPACQLVRFANASEKANGFIEAISSRAADDVSEGVSAKKLFSAEVNKNFPSSLASDSVVDAASVKLFMEDAFLTYADVADSAGGNDFRPSADSNATFNSVALSSNLTWRLNATSNAVRPAGLAQDVQIGDTVQLYTGSGSSATLIKTSKVAGFGQATNAASMNILTQTIAGDYTPSNPGTITIGNVEFAINVSNAFNTAAKLTAADPRQFGASSNQYTISIEEVRKDAILVIKVVTLYGNDGAPATELEVDGTNSITLPSGIVITPSLIAGKDPQQGVSGLFVYGPRHVAYAYDAAGGQGKVFVSVVDQNALNGITQEILYNITCIKGGAVNTSTGTTFRWINLNNPSNTGTFDVKNLDDETQVHLIANGIAFNVGALPGTSSTSDDLFPGFVGSAGGGDTITVRLVPGSAGSVATLIVADPYTSANPITRVRLSKVKTVEIPTFKPGSANVNWTLEDVNDSEIRRIKIQPQVVLQDTSVVGEAYVTAGKLYAQFRSFVSLPRDVGSVNTLSDITSQLGTIDPENPLAYAVFKAFTNANGATVHYIPTVSDSLNGYRGYADALALAKGNRNCYSLVPLSASPEVWNAFVAHVQDESAPEAGRYRILWIAPEVERHFKIQDSAVGDATKLLRAVISSAGNNKYTVVSEVDVDSRFTETTRIGDWVKVQFDNDIYGNPVYREYRVTSVVDNKTLIISSAVAITTLGVRNIEIYRDLTSAEVADKYVQIAGGFSSERVFAVVPNRGVNGLRVDGKPIKNYNIAAAFAGLRSGSRPHQPLSNVELLGFDGINATVPSFNEADLDTMRDGGIWVVVTNEEGKTYVERQLSTSTFDIFRKEQSVTCNIDSMSFSIGDGLRNLVGRVNINDGNLSLVRASLVSILTSFMNATGSETIGAQLNSYTIDQIFVPSTANDTIKAKISISVPLPMNIIDITIVV